MVGKLHILHSKSPPNGEAPAENQRSGLDDRLKNNLIVVVVGVAVAAGSVVAGVGEYFREQSLDELKATQKIEVEKLELQHVRAINELKLTYDRQADQLTSRITSVERRLGDQKYLDIQKFFTAQPATSRTQSGEIVFNAAADFFALHDEARWNYFKSNEADATSEIVRTPIPYAKAVREMMERIPIYVWHGKDEYRLAEGPLKKLFPYIFVQVVPLDEIPHIAGMARPVQPDLVDNADIEIEKRSPDPEHETKLSSDKLQKMISGTVHSDVVGFFLTTQLVNMFRIAAADENMTYSLRNIQKVGPVLYCQIVMRFDDVTVNDQEKGRLYMVREYFVISRNDKLILVQTNALSTTPAFTGGYFDDITLWLGNFYLSP